MLNEHDLSLSGRDSVGRNKEFDIPFNSHYVAGLSHQRDGGVSRPVLSSTVENVHSVPHSERDESRAIVGQDLELLSPHLQRLLDERFAEAVEKRRGEVNLTMSWVECLEGVDRARGRTPLPLSSGDPQSQLRALTESMGSFGFVFDVPRRRDVSCNGQVLRVARNDFVHQRDFLIPEVYRICDAATVVLSILGKGLRDDALETLKHSALKRLWQQAVAMRESRASETSQRDTRASSSRAEPSTVRSVNLESPTKDLETLSHERANDNGPLPFASWNERHVGTAEELDSIRSGATKKKIQALIREVVACEGPIHIDRLKTLVGKGFGLSRVRGSRVDQLIWQIKSSALHIDQHRFVWPDGLDPSTWRGFRTRESGPNLEEVSPREIANAYAYARALDELYSEETLERLTLRMLGGKVMSTRSRNAIRRALALYFTLPEMREYEAA